MIIITGIKLKNGGFKMQAPVFPYTERTFLGYSLEEMKKEYRKIHHLEHKCIEWIIL